jgi:hypothetical protein
VPIERRMSAERNVLLVALTASIGALIIGIGVGHYALPTGKAKDDRPDAAEQRRADLAMAYARVRAAIPALEAWHADHNTYAGATLAGLREYDQGVTGVEVVFATRDDYCLESRVDGAVASKHGPGGPPTNVACPR